MTNYYNNGTAAAGAQLQYMDPMQNFNQPQQAYTPSGYAPQQYAPAPQPGYQNPAMGYPAQQQMYYPQQEAWNYPGYPQNCQQVQAQDTSSRSIFGILKTILTSAMVLIAVGMMAFTIISVTTFDRSDRTLFGYKSYIVRSDSMSATDFSAGDLILVKDVDPATLQAGDIISFTSENSSNFGEVVTHKIREKTVDANGNPAFITYGTTTDTDDETPVTYSYVLGKYQRALPGVGSFFAFLKTTPGYICCILLPFLSLILMQGIRSIRLFRQYKQEQLEELEYERSLLQAQREQTQQMMAELQRMHAGYGYAEQG